MTTAQVNRLLEKCGRTWKEFQEFMVGQTVGGTPDNPDWYECDVNRFLANKKVID